jgi:peptide/nickel transport system substrate-binding protein
MDSVAASVVSGLREDRAMRLTLWGDGHSWGRRIGFGWLALLLIIAACASPTPSPQVDSPSTTAQGERAAAKRVVAAIRGYPKSVAVAIDGAGLGSTAGIREVEQLLHNGLGTLDNDGKLLPRLAEAVPTIENGLWKLHPDGRMETTWRILPTARWQDGTPFTADDLVFTEIVGRDRSLTMITDSAFDAMDRIEAIDQRTVVVHWAKPYINADRLLSPASSQSLMPLPRHLLEAPYLADRASFTQAPYWGPEFVGTGPFKLREFALDSHLVVVANDGYLLGRPKIDEIEVRFIGDFNIMVANVLSGAVELTLGRGLSFEQAVEARERWTGGRMQTGLASITALFPQFVNASPAVVGEVSFRRALLRAMDRWEMAATFQGGLSPVAENPIIPTDPLAAEVENAIVRYPYDPRLAAQQIEALGYVRGPDGVARDSSGQPLAVKIQTTQDDLREKLLSTIASHWRQVGVVTEGVIISRQASSDRQLRSEFASFDFTRQPTDLTRYRSSEAPLAENNYRGNNRGRYRSADLDAFIDRYLVTIPKAERTQMLAAMVHHVTDQLVVMGICYVVEPALITNRLVNMSRRSVDESVDTWNAHEWELRS